MRSYRGLALILIGWAASATATTWDEPWQEQVVRDADSFGLFEVTKYDGATATLRTVERLGGQHTPESFTIASPLGADTHGHAHGEKSLDLPEKGFVYLWLDGAGKQWKLLTPTAGIDRVLADGTVAATYRISFNKAAQSRDAYERVQHCIYVVLHDGACNFALLAADLEAPLQEEAAALSETASALEQARFFRQHVALETAFLTDRTIAVATLEPFLQKDFFHTQISAVRALSASDDPARDARWIAFIRDDTRNPTARAMALLLARMRDNAAVIAGIAGYEPSDPQADCSLPVDIMDPRVGTHFPSTLAKAFAYVRGDATQ